MPTIRKFDKAHLAELFQNDERHFLHDVKKQIKKDFPEWFEKLKPCENPDIGIDENFYIYISDFKKGKHFETNLTINDYI